jgi:hypothetical protein
MTQSAKLVLLLLLLPAIGNMLAEVACLATTTGAAGGAVVADTPAHNTWGKEWDKLQGRMLLLPRDGLQTRQRRQHAVTHKLAEGLIAALRVCLHKVESYDDARQ